MGYKIKTLTSAAALTALLWGCKTQQVVNTYTIRDTVRIETVRVDTAIKINTDTVRIIKDRLKLKYVQINDTLYLEGECIGDTVYLEKVIELPVAKPEEPKLGFLERLLIYAFSLVILIIIVREVIRALLK